MEDYTDCGVCMYITMNLMNIAGDNFTMANYRDTNEVSHMTRTSMNSY